MNRTLLFASSNPHKLEEIRTMLPDGFFVLSLKDISWTQEIPEPFETFEENAGAKTSLLFQATGRMCFAEDSGLEIDALGGRPGVYSARYAGQHGNSEKNIEKVLLELRDHQNRSARFKSVIAFQSGRDILHYFSGVVEGAISEQPSGRSGFGYDPVFIPKGFDQTFATLPVRLKNQISHRAISMRRFIEFLRSFKS